MFALLIDTGTDRSLYLRLMTLIFDSYSYSPVEIKVIIIIFNKTQNLSKEIRGIVFMKLVVLKVNHKKMNNMVP
jgi:hypothetical protein